MGFDKMVDSTSSVKAFNDPNVRTILDHFFRGMRVAKRAGDSRFLGYRTGWSKSSNNFAWLSYEDVAQLAKATASGLIHLGLKPGNETFIGIYSLNCPEWLVCALSCVFQSWVIVPLYSTSSDSSIVHIVGECELKTCFVKSRQDTDRILQLLPGSPVIQTIVSFEEPDEAQLNQAHEYNVKLISLKHLQELGNASLQAPTIPQPDDLLTICYTSGTTGPPKGAMLTHANFGSVIDSQAKFFEQIEEEGKECMISYLPLAHTLGFGLELSCMSRGYKVAYYSGDIKRLFDDMKEIRPTLLPTVPRLLDRVYTEIQKKIDRKKIGVFKSVLFKLMFSLKRRSLNNGDYRKQQISDRVVFGPIQAMFGGRLKLVLVGSSPSHPDVLGFMKVVLGCIVIEGYGQTECTGASHTQPLYDMSVSNVGRVIQCCECKIVDAPELKYYARNNSGELCIRGANVFQGYYKNAEATAQVLDEQGWLHTGDIVLLTKDKRVSIVDRKNEIFKLSQGEYVVPSKLEKVYQQLDLIQSCFVYGSPFKSFTVAVVVPDKEALMDLAKKNNIAGDFESVCQNKKTNELVLKAVEQASQIAQFNGVEKVRRVFLTSKPFTIEDGLLTPTMKLRRGVCARHFRAELDGMYNQKMAE